MTSKDKCWGSYKVYEDGAYESTQISNKDLKKHQKATFNAASTPTPAPKDDTVSSPNQNIADNISTGYEHVTANKLYDNLKIYVSEDPTNPDKQVEHAFTILNFSNDNGAFSGRVYVYDVTSKTNTWMKIKDIENMSGSLIKLDDPAIKVAKKTVKAVEADNYMHPDPSYLREGMALYEMDLYTGDMHQSQYTVFKAGFPTMQVYNLDTGTIEKVDASYISNNFYVMQ